MFQVVFPMMSGTDNESIKNALPEAWTVVSSSQGQDRLWLENKFTGETIGNVVRERTNVIISADETTILGKQFWQEFGLKYAELNPFDLRFGVLYLPDGKGNRWELDEFPKHSQEEVLSDVSHYVNANSPRFVSFFYGDWHPQCSIRVKICKKISKNGSLGKDEGKLLFLLGSIENESTM